MIETTELIIAIVCLIASFIGTFFLTKIWIFVAKNIKLQGKDMNKLDQRKVSEAGGIAVIMGIVFSILLYVFFKSFLIESELNMVYILALVTSMLLAGFIGFLDDILGWLKGINQKTKVLLTIPVALPLIVVNAGQSVLNIPIIGLIDFGIFYPIIIIPLAIIGATNGYNMLAGYNGLEAGLGVIILTTLSYIAFVNTGYWLALIGMIAVASLLAFLYFNWYPAKVFPGDSLTYGIGLLIASMAILGNMQTYAVILFIPFMIDFILTSRSKFKAAAFAKLNKDGSMEVPYDKFYDSTHVAITAPGAKVKFNVIKPVV